MIEDNFNSEILHNDFPKKDVYGSISMPVYNTAAFEFDTAEDMEAAFAGRTNAYTYSRISNPTVENFERRIANVTDALNVTALSSGMAAISNTLIAIAFNGANVVTSKHLFGNTYSLLKSTFACFGIETRFCDLTNPADVEKNIDGNTCMVFLEIITNPQLEVADLSALSIVCKNKHVPLVADTTVVPFCAFRASEFGVNIEIVSSTKYISGGATSVGGLIVDYGTFDWKSSPKLGKLAEQFGPNTFNSKLRSEIHRNIGAYMTPQVAHLQNLGLETLKIRYEQMTKTTTFLVKALQCLPGIEHVNYPTLEGNHFREISLKQFGNHAGAMFTIDLESKEACFRFMNKLKVIRRATNLFDNQSLAIHPATTIYVNFSASDRKLMNVSDKTIRFSVGLEEKEILFQDITQALMI